MKLFFSSFKYGFSFHDRVSVLEVPCADRSDFFAL